MEQIKQLEDIFPEQNPSGAVGCEPGFPQLHREAQKGCLHSNTNKSLLAGCKHPLGDGQAEGGDLYLFNCLPTKRSAYCALQGLCTELVTAIRLQVEQHCGSADSATGGDSEAAQSEPGLRKFAAWSLAKRGLFNFIGLCSSNQNSEL